MHQHVVEDVGISQTEDGWRIRVSFSLPMMYRSYFPTHPAKEILVRILPVNEDASLQTALFSREALSFRHENEMSLYQILFEGDKEEGPFLTLQFTNPVQADVKQGKDFRSIVIHVDEGRSKSDQSD